jgi:hypothetical protein
VSNSLFLIEDDSGRFKVEYDKDHPDRVWLSASCGMFSWLKSITGAEAAQVSDALRKGSFLVEQHWERQPKAVEERAS